MNIFFEILYRYAAILHHNVWYVAHRRGLSIQQLDRLYWCVFFVEVAGVVFMTILWARELYRLFQYIPPQNWRLI